MRSSCKSIGVEKGAAPASVPDRRRQEQRQQCHGHEKAAREPYERQHADGLQARVMGYDQARVACRRGEPGKQKRPEELVQRARRPLRRGNRFGKIFGKEFGKIRVDPEAERDRDCCCQQRGADEQNGPRPLRADRKPPSHEPCQLRIHGGAQDG